MAPKKKGSQASDMDFIAAIATSSAEVNGDNETSLGIYPFEEIYIDPQVRLSYDDHEIAELAASIEETGADYGDIHLGLLQPVGLGPKNDAGKRPVVYGHRRYLACERLKAKGMTGVRYLLDEKAHGSAGRKMLTQMIENIQRSDLHAIEVAIGCAAAREDGYSSSDIAKKLGKHASWVSKRMKIATLPESVLFDAKLPAMTSDADALYALAQLCELDLGEGLKAFDDGKVQGTLSRKALEDKVVKIKDARVVKDFPSLDDVRQAIVEHYLSNPDVHLEFVELATKLNIQDRYHTQFTAYAYPVFEHATGEAKKHNEKAEEPPVSPSNTSPAGKGGNGSDAQPEKLPEAGKGGNGSDAQPEKLPEAGKGGNGSDAQPEKLPEAGKGSVSEIAHTPSISAGVLVYFMDGEDRVEGTLVTSKEQTKGQEADPGCVLISVDSQVISIPAEELRLLAVKYA